MKGKGSVPRRRQSAAAFVQKAGQPAWLDIVRVAHVEASSQQVDHPVEHAVAPAGGTGWQASVPGAQVVRLTFRRPTNIRLIRLVFSETDRERTQEFTLGWAPDGSQTVREIVRQQFNFSPSGATREVEEFQVELPDASRLELRIVPDIQGGEALASLAELAIASAAPGRPLAP